MTDKRFQYDFDQLARYENGRTPVLLTEDQYRRARACVNACSGIPSDMVHAVVQFGINGYSKAIADMMEDRDTWRERAEFSYRERDALDGKVKLLLEVAQNANDNTAAVIHQRDELLAALDSMVNSYQRIKPLGYPKCDSEKQADEAIASAKGSAS